MVPHSSIPFATIPYVMLFGVGYGFYGVYIPSGIFGNFFLLAQYYLRPALSATRNFPLFISGSIQDTKSIWMPSVIDMPSQFDSPRKWVL